MAAQRHAAAIAGRVVFNTNRNPAPRQFRALTAPPVFDAFKKRRYNLSLTAQLSGDLTNLHLNPSYRVRGSSVLTSEILASAKQILPNVVENVVSKFSSTVDKSTPPMIENIPRQTYVNISPQTLEEDDIDEYDSE